MEEKRILMTLYPLFGNDWKLYVQWLQGRTPEAIRTQWHWMTHRRPKKEKKEPEQKVVEEDWSFLEFCF
jgi:hypothetical protein